MKTYYLHVCWQVQKNDRNIAINDGLYTIKSNSRNASLGDLRKAVQEQIGDCTMLPNIISMTILPKKLFRVLGGQ